MDELNALREFFSSADDPEAPVVQRQREKLMSHISASANELDATTGGAAPTPPTSIRPSKRRRIAALVGIPAAAVLLAAAGWAVFHTQAHEAYRFACQGADILTIMPNDGTPPVEACRQEWVKEAERTGTPVPSDLVACLDKNASVVVIKGTGTQDCAAAGMSKWTEQPEYEAAGRAVRAVLIGFHDRAIATGNGCATVAEWRSGLAKQSETKGWAVDVNQVESSRHCYDVDAIDPTAKTITLIGMPGEYSIGCDPRKGC